ncbi:MAG TPA: FAD-binding and (Fe-S)-binding domain-containing protein [Hyphomicrobium sp.]|jgi:FAD/FMN-containing dehydrogenase/Fe-S oxidoreductase
MSRQTSETAQELFVDQPTQQPRLWTDIVSKENAKRLAASLKTRTTAEVRFDDPSRALYCTDASNYRQVPIGVVIPKRVEDVVETLALCREYGAPFLSRGGGTSLCGQSCNAAVLVDFSKYLNSIIELDPTGMSARVEPGCVLDTLRNAAERHHLTFGPDPSTHDHNTLGGMVGNNSCGVHSVMAGRTADNVKSLKIITYQGLQLTVGATSDAELRSIIAAGGKRGEIYRRLAELRDRYAQLIRDRYPKIPRRVSGYNLDELLTENGFNVARALVGSEGTCVTVLEATLDLVHSPPARALAVLGFEDIFRAADAAAFVRKRGPIGLEAMDDKLIEFMRDKHRDMSSIEVLPEGKGWLIAEFGGDAEKEAADKAEELKRAFETRSDKPNIKISTDPAEQERIWKAREAGLGSTAFVPHHPDAWEGWEDSAVSPERLGGYLRGLKTLFRKYGYDSTLYGHFGDGCVHCRINFGLRTTNGLVKMRRFLDEAADLVVEHGGSISGEHGDGQSKAELLPRMFGPELIEAFREFKSIWDPDGMMNPGKVVDPFPIASNLRLGPDYVPPKVETHFKFPDDEGNFARAGIRCVGVGKCRSADPHDNVMCPSYMATSDEMHVTRGRARLLFEMLHGGAIEKTWRNDAVEEALDLCLACKGCKGDCPVNVDMATYKAEFRSHYYEGRLRPRAAYSMGLIHRWARIASHMPRIANALIQAPGLNALAKLAGGIAQERQMPSFATESYWQWHNRRAPPQGTGKPVILFVDTFNNYFRPQTAIDATRVLEGAGFRVIIPQRPVCCGRPLFDWGMLKSAKSLLNRVLAQLAPEVNNGTPVIGLEPACTATFRDELINLFPENPTARRLSSQTLLFSEFIDEHSHEFAFEPIHRKAIVQIHCHHHSVMKDAAERRVLDRLGLEYDVMPSGCCGMAGSFGFESAKYDLSMKAAERVMLPTVRAATPETLVLANGFSCREQIEQATGRTTLHLAELIAGRAKPGSLA